MKPTLECSGCRRRKEIETIFRQYKYCKQCVDAGKMPTSKQLSEYFLKTYLEREKGNYEHRN
jgi:hypothetical protein